MPVHYMTLDEVTNIPQESLPLLVLSDNVRSFFAAGIKRHEKGLYNHLMWLVEPNVLASQDLTFKKAPLESYLRRHRLKFWHCPEWTVDDRAQITAAINFDLQLPLHMRLYDWVQIIGKATGLDWLQVPGYSICSDKAEYLKFADPRYDLFHPSPPEVDRWLNKNLARYAVFGRYSPD